MREEAFLQSLPNPKIYLTLVAQLAFIYDVPNLQLHGQQVVVGMQQMLDSQYIFLMSYLAYLVYLQSQISFGFIYIFFSLDRGELHIRIIFTFNTPRINRLNMCNVYINMKQFNLYFAQNSQYISIYLYCTLFALVHQILQN